MLDGEMVINKDNGFEAQNIVRYLNDKLGPVAKVGKLLPPRVVTDVPTRGHVALVENPCAKYPNGQFSAFERVADTAQGMPQFQKIDVERFLRMERADAGKAKARAKKVQMAAEARKNKTPSGKPVDLEAQAMEQQLLDLNVEFASPRLACQLDYTTKARKFREVCDEKRTEGAVNGRCSVPGYQITDQVMLQFKREQARDLIKNKFKSWGTKRKKTLYNNQRKKRMKVCDWKNELDPAPLMNEGSIWNKARR